MDNKLKSAKFITTEFENYTDISVSPWGKIRNRNYQHTDLNPWKGLPMFAKDFDITAVENAVITFTALGCAAIFINGKRIGTGELDPGWTDYTKRTLYKSYEISGYLKEGKNRILAVVSAGWYAGRISGARYGVNSPAFMAEIENGGKIILSTDESWLAKVGGQIRTADIWDGEYRDGREDCYGVISENGYDISGWDKAEIFNYSGEVTPFIGTEVRTRPEISLKPASMKITDGVSYNGTYYGKVNVCNADAKLPLKLLRGQKLIVDFNQETVGWLKINFEGESGTAVKMRYAEFLNDSGDLERGNDGPEGSVYTVNLRSALGKAYYIFGDKSPVTYRPTFTFFGYRYVEISAEDDITINNLTAEVVGNDNTETGRIETSNALVNKLISNALWGQRSNYLSVPTDCPQRDERLGWTGDAQAFSITASYNADVYGFFRKWMQDLRDGQSESGGYGDVNPRVGCCSSEDACAWADAGIIIPYNMYRMFGDNTIISEHFSSMEKYMNGLVDKYGWSGAIPRYGDWLAYDWCSNEFISSAYFVHDCDLMIRMSDAIGKADKAEYYKDMREKAYSYFCEHFMKDGKPVEQTQCNKIMVLAFNLAPEDKTAEIADELAEQIHNNGDRLSCGFLGTYNLCPTLSKYGKNKTAYNLLLQRNEPSWLYSIDQGATTIWERWNSYTKDKGFGDVGMNSFNHYAYGAIVEWMYRFMAGIQPEEPGFAKIKLSPVTDTRKASELPEGQENIRWVKASYKSVNGLITSEWNTENGFTYKCSVPVDAKLLLPVTGNKIIMNGSEISPEITDGTAVINLAPGEYTFIQ